MLPTGTVTFLFTDIEGSTHLWEEHPEEMKPALARHDSILKDAIESNRGHIIKTTGDGVHAVFEKAIEALRAAIQAQHSLGQAESNLTIRVRMGLHTGEAELRDGDYYGQTLNRGARIMSAGHGGQVLISGVTAQVAGEHLPNDVELLDMGEHHLKGLIKPEHIFQVNAPGLGQNFPPLQSLPLKTNNIPPALTSFIGREHELDESNRLLASARLVAFIGPGGTGKTRLSLQVAAEQLAEFRDGVWFVELAPISDPANIITAIASAFELREVQNIPLLTILLDYLRAKHLLLILDNCEHLVEGSAQIADQILHACPQVKILASSREALGISGEAVFRVPPLKESESTDLFVERATKADSRFKLNEHNAPFIRQVCSRLDGIPLAIELAAARVKLFTPEQIAQRLDDRFKLLTGGSRTALPRQQTLRALIDWSYQSLNESEQRALRRLAVFSGGWTIEGAESVLEESEALDSLASLVNKSLVNVEEGQSESRYRFLETIRQYAMEKLLESGEAVEARDRHLDYVLGIAEVSEQRMFGAESPDWLNQMEAEHDNLRVALEWATSNHIEKAIRLALGIGGFWMSRDYNSEAREWCRTILERSKTLANSDANRARVYSIWGWTAITTGNHKEGHMAAETGLALAKKAGDKQAIIRLLVTLGLSTLFIGDVNHADAPLEEAIQIAREEGLKGELAMAITSRAQANYFGTQNPTLAKQYLEEATALGNEAGLSSVTTMTAYGAGRLAGHLGDVETARVKFMESAEISKRLGNRRMVYSSRSELAHVLREHGILDEAFEIYKEVIPSWLELGHRAALAHELECIGYILGRKEEPERAAALFGAAEAIRKLIDGPRTPIEEEEFQKEIAMLRDMLGNDEFERHYAKGNSMTIEQAIQLALA